MQAAGMPKVTAVVNNPDLNFDSYSLMFTFEA
jgi:hypothetical protein